METIRWGILAAGGIAGALAYAINHTEGAELLAIGSRDQAKAEAFGDRFQIPRRYGSYEALVADPDVDIVYVSSPHPFHYENMRLCLEAGKHVLCEKPFMLNAEQTASIIKLAREKKLFAMEAMWTRFLPSIFKVRELIAEGAIGDVVQVQASFNFSANYDPEHRLFNLKLGGGALLDVGIYPLAFASMILGKPQQIRSLTTLGKTGSDENSTVIMHYAGGQLAILSAGLRASNLRSASIGGTKGAILLPDDFFRAEYIILHPEGGEKVRHDFPFRANGYEYEVEAINDCLRAGQLESALMPLDETLALSQQMDEIREDWGLVYPGE